ncbi:amidohydrolase family protein [Acuticoccus yangtzensis]|uniref:amidohydrolase family protein n=1 Tax=Acuticoccus yangtzensis TaxID=1443441 RepID=UPI0009499BE3|nr:amidohydrolase family protein [Acuticoccus yangtzensis]
MHLDAFTHFFPPAYFARMQELVSNKGSIKRWLNLPTLWDLEARRKMVGSFADYQQILTNSMPPVEFVASPQDSPELARIGNDGLAELVAKYPDEFPAFAASLPMNNPEAAVAEVNRAIGELGAVGVQIHTNVNGRPLDEAAFFPIFEAVAKHDKPVWLHPCRGPGFADYKSEDKSKYEIWWTFGWPYETSAAMSRMVFSGMFDKLPNLKVITHHMGAMIPFFEGRVGPGWDQLGSRTDDEDYEALLEAMPHRPVDYFKRFYADTALFGSDSGTRCGLDFFGADNIVFASDCPFDPENGFMFIRETMAVIDRLEVSDEVRQKILSGNIKALTGLK